MAGAHGLDACYGALAEGAHGERATVPQGTLTLLDRLCDRVSPRSPQRLNLPAAQHSDLAQPREHAVLAAMRTEELERQRDRHLKYMSSKDFDWHCLPDGGAKLRHSLEQTEQELKDRRQGEQQQALPRSWLHKAFENQQESNALKRSSSSDAVPDRQELHLNCIATSRDGPYKPPPQSASSSGTGGARGWPEAPKEVLRRNCDGCSERFIASKLVPCHGKQLCHGCLKRQKPGVRTGDQSPFLTTLENVALSVTRRNAEASAHSGAHGKKRLRSAGSFFTLPDGACLLPVSKTVSSAVEHAKEPSSIIEIGSDDDMNMSRHSSGSSPRRSQRLQLCHGKTASQLFKGFKAVYPPNGKSVLEIFPEDLARLEPMEFLNDTIIDFYIKWLEYNLPESEQCRFHFFNSFFYSKLTERIHRTCTDEDVAQLYHKKVRKWTKDVDLFSKDFVFVPIHEALHWSLAVICHPGAEFVSKQDMTNMGILYERDVKTPCILHLDSMQGGHTTGPIKKALTDYLTCEWASQLRASDDNVPKLLAAAHPDMERQRVFVPGSTIYYSKRANLPKQDNFCDCGLFVLAFMEFFLSGAPESLNYHLLDKKPEEPLSPKFPHFLRRDWFDKHNTALLRNHILTILEKLMLDQATCVLDPDLERLAVEIQQILEAPARWGTQYLHPREYLLLRTEMEAKQRNDCPHVPSWAQHDSERNPKPEQIGCTSFKPGLSSDNMQGDCDVPGRLEAPSSSSSSQDSMDEQIRTVAYRASQPDEDKQETPGSQNVIDKTASESLESEERRKRENLLLSDSLTSNGHKYSGKKKSRRHKRYRRAHAKHSNIPPNENGSHSQM